MRAMNLYDLERLSEARRAELRRQATAPVLPRAVAAGRSSFRQRLATALVALAVRLAP